jgi:hypothetical protein
LGILWRLSNIVVRDNNDLRAVGARGYFYDADTTAPRSTFEDAALTIAHTHPVIADANGRFPPIYLAFGDFGERVTTAGGTELFYNVSVPNQQPLDATDATPAEDVLTSGDIFCRLENTTRVGAVRANGRTIGNAASGATERADADCEALFAILWTAQFQVIPSAGATAALDFAAGKLVTLPDWRGTVPVGFDDMGNAAAGRFTGVTFSAGNATTVGSICGANTLALTIAQLPVVTPAGTIGAITPAGTISTITPAGTIGGTSQNYTPAGSIGGTSQNYTPAGSIGGTSQNYTPAGTIAVTLSSSDHAHTLTYNQRTDVAVGGAQTAVTAIATSGLANAVNTTTQGTGVGVASQTFTGTAATISLGANATFTGTVATVPLGANATFTGTIGTVPLGANATFTGTAVTPTFAGTAVTPTFAGTAFGSGAAHPIMQRSMPVTWFIHL